jgi:hypothetical protein
MLVTDDGVERLHAYERGLLRSPAASPGAAGTGERGHH